MSDGLSICIWPAALRRKDLGPIFELLLSSILDPNQVEMTQIEVCKRQLPVGDDRESVVFYRDWERRTILQVVEALAKFSDGTFSWEVRTLWKGSGWDYETEAPKVESFGVDVSFFGAEFQRGRDHFQQGPFQITFNNKWDFSNLVVGQSTGEVACSTRKRMREIGLVVPEPRSFRRFVSNQAFLDRIVSRICNGLVPLHLVVITSGESINPFNSYMIYHSSLSGFLHDIRKVLQLHELGGGYFYEGIRRFSSGPSRSSLRDGFSDYASAPFDSARSPSEAEELIQRLDDYVDLIGTPGKGELQLSDEQIYEALLLSSEVEVREIGGGVMLVQPEMPFRCLESPFFGLLNEICESRRFLN